MLELHPGYKIELISLKCKEVLRGMKGVYSIMLLSSFPQLIIRKRDTFSFPGSVFSASFNKMNSAEETNPKHFSQFPFLKSILLSPSTVNDIKSRGQTRGN